MKPTTPNNPVGRYWINQPSTLQPLHRLHATKVLAAPYLDNTALIYFLSGDVVSMVVPKECLSEGWPKWEKPYAQDQNR